MDNGNDNKDSLNSINDLFGTNINVSDKPKIDNDKKYEDIPNINQVVKEKEEEKEEVVKEEPVNVVDNNEKQEDNIETSKFINEDYVNDDSNKEDKLIDKVEENNDNDENEIIYLVKHFDMSKVKFNLATISLLISTIGGVFYNLIIVIPGLALSYMSYKQVKEGKGEKQDLLFGLLGMVICVFSLISIILSKVSGIINFGF